MVARHLPATPRLTIGPSHQPLVCYPPHPFRLPRPPASPNCRRLFRHYPLSTGVPIDPYVRPSRRTSVYLAARRGAILQNNFRMPIPLSLKGSLEGHLTPLVDLATSKYTHTPCISIGPSHQPLLGHPPDKSVFRLHLRLRTAGCLVATTHTGGSNGLYVRPSHRTSVYQAVRAGMLLSSRLSRCPCAAAPPTKLVPCSVTGTLS